MKIFGADFIPKISPYFKTIEFILVSLLGRGENFSASQPWAKKTKKLSSPNYRKIVRIRIKVDLK